MPSHRGMEQCLTWLRSKMAEKDTLDGINAEVVYNVLMDLRAQNNRLGSMVNNLLQQKKKEEGVI